MIIRLILCFLIVIGYTKAGEYKHAYLAVAGPTNGPGIMGHSYLIVSQSPWVFIGAKAYQFALDFEQLPESLKNADQGLGPLEIARLAGAVSDLPLTLSSVDAYEFTTMYQAENRAVISYELDMSEDQVSQLVANLEQDYEALREGTYAEPGSFQSKYDLLKSNCATVLFRKINNVLPEDRKLDLPIFPVLFDENGSMVWSNLLNKQALLGTVPLFWVRTLERNELVGESRLFKPHSVIRAELMNEFIANFNSIATTCGIDENSLNVYINFFSNDSLLQNEEGLKIILDRIQICRANADEGVYDQLLSLGIVISGSPLQFIPYL